MHGLIIALAGTFVAIGVNAFRPAPVVNAPLAVTVEAEVSVPHESRAPVLLEVRDRTIEQVVASFREQAGRPVIVHWSALSDIGIEKENPVDIDSEPLPVDLVFKILAERDRGIDDSIALLSTSDHVEIGLQSVFDHRTTVRRIYTLSDLGASESDMPLMRNGSPNSPADTNRAVSEYLRSVAEMLVDHVSSRDWVVRAGSLANYSVVGQSIVVTAPERIHGQIAMLLADVRTETERRAEIETNERQSIIGKLRSEYKQAMMLWNETSQDINKIERMIAEVKGKISASDDAESRAAGEVMVIELQGESDQLRMRLDEFEARIRYLRSRMIASEYESLFDGLATSHQPPVALHPDSLRIEGAVTRPGDYQVPVDGMTLRRAITAAGGVNGTEGRIHIARDGVHFMTATIRAVYEESGEIELKAGDRVSVAVTPDGGTD